MFWNVRGISLDVRRSFIRETIYNRKMDFVEIHETIKSNFSKTELHNLCGGINFDWKWSQPKEGSGGILVGINCDSFDIISIEIGVYFVRILVFDKKAKFE